MATSLPVCIRLSGDNLAEVDAHALEQNVPKATAAVRLLAEGRAAKMDKAIHRFSICDPKSNQSIGPALKALHEVAVTLRSCLSALARPRPVSASEVSDWEKRNRLAEIAFASVPAKVRQLSLSGHLSDLTVEQLECILTLTVAQANASGITEAELENVQRRLLMGTENTKGTNPKNPANTTSNVSRASPLCTTITKASAAQSSPPPIAPKITQSDPSISPVIRTAIAQANNAIRPAISQTTTERPPSPSFDDLPDHLFDELCTKTGGRRI